MLGHAPSISKQCVKNELRYELDLLRVVGLDIHINSFDSVDLYGCGQAHQLMAPNIESAICQD